jgi:hypothetical protein
MSIHRATFLAKERQDLKSFEKDTPFEKALPLDPYSSSDSTFSKISSWLDECYTCHLSCERPTSLPLPSRVLDLGPPSEQQQLRLIPGEGRRGQWVALSHAWGDFQPLRTTKETLPVHQAEIKWSELPPTFQDAVVITKKLGFQYLWIDSLCIIQDSPDDWDREAATMASVYGSAAITICAEAAANSQCDIFKSANSRRGIEVRLPAKSPQNSFEYDVYLKARGPENDGDFHIGYRAWVLQECLLSPRVIIYAADQVYWSCRAEEKSEGEVYQLGGSHGIVELGSYKKSLLFPTTGADNGDDKLTPSLHPARNQASLLKARGYLDYAHLTLIPCWYRILERYGSCNITKAEDRLPAIAGIAKRINALSGWKYLAGLWLEDIPRGLCWTSHGQTQTSSKYVGPTWSWVSLTNYPYNNSRNLCFPCTGNDFEVAEDIKVADFNIINATADKYMQVQEGSSLQITGLCCGSEYTVEPLRYGNRSCCQWVIYMSGKPQFNFWDTYLDVRGSPSDRKLTFLRLLQSRHNSGPFPAEVSLLILEKSLGDSGDYVRAGFGTVPMKKWRQMNLELWSVQSVTIICSNGSLYMLGMKRRESP